MTDQPPLGPAENRDIPPPPPPFRAAGLPPPPVPGSVGPSQRSGLPGWAIALIIAAVAILMLAVVAILAVTFLGTAASSKFESVGSADGDARGTIDAGEYIAQMGSIYDLDESEEQCIREALDARPELLAQYDPLAPEVEALIDLFFAVERRCVDADDIANGIVAGFALTFPGELSDGDKNCLAQEVATFSDEDLEGLIRSALEPGSDLGTDPVDDLGRPLVACGIDPTGS